MGNFFSEVEKERSESYSEVLFHNRVDKRESCIRMNLAVSLEVSVKTFSEVHLWSGRNVHHVNIMSLKLFT